MEIHQLKCDLCKCRANTKYNGEHWLPPEGWVTLWDDNLAEMLDQHICPKCAPKRPKETQDE